MLGVFLNSAPNSVNKRLGFTQTLTKKDFEFFLDNENVGFILYFLPVLLLAKKGGIFKEISGKGHLILTFGPGDSKIVITLQEVVIAL